MIRDPIALFLQFADPAYYPPVMHAAALLDRAGVRPLLLTFEAHGMAGADLPPDASIAEVVLASSGKGWRIKYDYLRYVARAIALCSEHRPACIYASDAYACLPAMLCAWMFKTPFAYHEHDAPGLPATWLAGCMYWWRGRAARSAVVNVVPSPGRVAEFLETTGAAPASVVLAMNCPMLDEIAGRQPARTDDEFRIYYHGSLNWERLPRAVIHALVQLPAQVKLWIVGYETVGSIGFTAELRELAKSLGLDESRIRLFGALDRHEFLEVCVHTDLGLGFMPKASRDSNMTYMAGASNKVFDYLACGVPLLVSPLPDWQALFVDRGVAVACDPTSADEIAAAISRAMTSPGELDAMREEGLRLLKRQWNYEHQFEPVATRLHVLAKAQSC